MGALEQAEEEVFEWCLHCWRRGRESKHRKRHGEKKKIPHWLETLGLAAAGTIAYVAALGASRRRGEKSCQQENG